MIDKCLICKLDNPAGNHFYSTHKITLKKYCEEYIKRKDLFSGENIIYKELESYLSADFNNRTNLKKYLEKVSKFDGLNYLKNYLENRKKSKNLIYSLSNFECRSLLFPSISFIHKFYGTNSYEKICNESGLKPRFNYSQSLEFDNKKKLEFIIDSREQDILDLDNFEISKLDFGDYTIKHSNIFIEKKSLSDFCGSLSKGFERFSKELQRCKDDNSYLIILVQEKFNNINSLLYLPHTKNIRASSEFIFHQARKLLSSFPLNCQIVCLDGKKEASKFVKKVFLLKNDIKSIDFQYFVDNGEI